MAVVEIALGVADVFNQVNAYNGILKLKPARPAAARPSVQELTGRAAGAIVPQT